VPLRMGHLFPGDDEYPAHEPLRSGFREICFNGPKLIVPFFVAGVTYGICPASHDQHEHAPHQESAPIDLPRQTLSVSGAAANPTFGSIDDSAIQAVRNGYTRR
jgi:hypothetical protein